MTCSCAVSRCQKQHARCVRRVSNKLPNNMPKECSRVAQGCLRIFFEVASLACGEHSDPQISPVTSLFLSSSYKLFRSEVYNRNFTVQGSNKKKAGEVCWLRCTQARAHRTLPVVELGHITYISNRKNMVLHLFGSGLQAFQEFVGWDSLNMGNNCRYLWNLIHTIDAQKFLSTTIIQQISSNFQQITPLELFSHDQSFN